MRGFNAVFCANGHNNLLPARYCGECGIPLDVASPSSPSSWPTSDGRLIPCPNGHQSPAFQSYCGECGARLIIAEPPVGTTSQVGLISPSARVVGRRHRGRIAWIVAAAIGFIGVVAATIVLLVRHPSSHTSASEQPTEEPSKSTSSTATQAPWLPTSQPQPGATRSTIAAPQPPNSQATLPDADGQGFLNYPGARCNDTNPAVVIARTSDSLVVICQTGVGRYYYKGFGLQNGLTVEIDDPTRTGGAFVATNNGVQYSVSRDALVITQGSNMLSNEPMQEYWSN